MAQSVLGVKTRGTGFPQAYRVIGAASYSLGATFLTQLIGSVSGGSFAPGDTVTYDAGTHTAVVTQVFAGRLILNSMSAGWAPAAGTITNGTASATASGVEGLENSGSSGFTRPCSRAIQHHNDILVYHYNTIYKLNQVTEFFEESYRVGHPVAADGSADSLRHLGLYVVNISGVRYLVTLYSDGSNTYRIRSQDGTSWSEAFVSSNTAVFLNSGGVQAVLFMNVLHLWTFTPSAQNTAHFDPSTDAYSVDPDVWPFSEKPVVWNNRMFALNHPAYGNLIEYTGGVWVSTGATNPTGNAWDECPFVSPSSGALIVITGTGSSGLAAVKFTMSGGGAIANGIDITSSILPSALSGTAHAWMVDAYMDQEANALTPGPAKLGLWFATSDSPGVARSYYEYVDDATMMIESATGCPSEIALPNTVNGGGDRSYFPGELDVDRTLALVPVTGGEKHTLVVYPQSLNTTIAVASNGVALPTGTIFVDSTDNFPSSGALYVTTGAGVQTVEYTGLTGGGSPSFTGVTGGTGVMATGGAVKFVVLDVKLKILYGNLGNAPDTGLATLANPSYGSLSGAHEVDGLVADGVTALTVDALLVSADGQPNFSNVQRAVAVYT